MEVEAGYVWLGAEEIRMFGLLGGWLCIWWCELDGVYERNTVACKTVVLNAEAPSCVAKELCVTQLC